MSHFKKSAFKSALDFNARQLRLAMAIIAEQKQLLITTKAAVPPDIATHIQHCVHTEQRILIYTEAACWASQIRFFSEAILNKFSASGQINIKEIQVRLCQQNEYMPKPRKACLPSAETIHQICNQFTDTSSEDSLTNSLIKLGKTLEKRKLLRK